MNNPVNIQPSEHRPPPWADRLLEWFCDPKLLEEVQGDLHELYGKWVNKYEVRKARLIYLFHVVKFFRPFAIRRKKYVYPLNSTAMIRNYFKISLRHLWRQKGFSLVNVFGLMLGTVCCLYAILYVHDQSDYDVHHPNADKLYRITTEVTEPEGSPLQMATTSPPVAEALQQDYPEVTVAARLFKDIGVDRYLFTEGTDSFYESKGYYVDSSFFKVFSYRFLEGTPEHALDEPFTVVLSSRIAQKLFDDQAAFGKSVTINGNLYKITGVFDEKWGKSHIRPDFLMSFQNTGIAEFIRTSQEWVGQNLVYTYISLSPQTQPEAFAEKLPAFFQQHAKAQMEQMNVRIQKELHLQRVTDIHLTSQLDSELEKNANPRFTRLVIIIACLIQLMACINFMNLSTARFFNRAKEVGVRKVVGATRRSIMFRFLGESFILSAVSILLAIPILIWTVPFVNEFVNASISFSFFYYPVAYIILITLIMGTGLLAGSFPAFYLSAYKSVSVLKGNFSNRLSFTAFRKGMVVTQFVVSVTLMMSIIIISQQLSFLQNKKLGFDRQQKIVFPFRVDEAKKQVAAFTHEISAMAQIGQVSTAAYYPSHWLGETLPVFYQSEAGKKGTGIWVNRVDENFLQTLQISLLSGRNFTATDQANSVIVNETALRELSISPGNVVGATITSEYRDMLQDSYTIIGVVKDFNFRSLKDPMRPLMLVKAAPDQANYVIADVQADMQPALLSRFEQIWQKLIPEVPFEYSFLQEDLQQQYQADSTLFVIINNLALIAVLIACLGLFSLAAFTAEQRTKEIGIRKVMGADIGSIIFLLVGNFLKLVILAIVLSVPIAWYLMDQWLQDFAYRIDIAWWTFALAGFSAIVIAIFTVSFQSIKAALTNPVNTLRNE